MRWVTGESAQAGRLMQGWLVKRFVDPDAVFLYALYAPSTADLSKIDATPFMIDGHPLGRIARDKADPQEDSRRAT